MIGAVISTCRARLLAMWVSLGACGPGKADSAGESETGLPGSTGVGHSSTPTTSGPGDGPTSETGAPPDDPGASTGVDDGGSSGVPPIPGPPPVPEPCDPWLENCPAGLKCVPVDEFGAGTWDALRCRPVDPAGKQPGKGCSVADSELSGFDDCQFHALCLEVDGELHGRCYGMCTGSPGQPVCPEGLACAQHNQGLLNLCLTPCDPLDPITCDGEVCIPNGQGFVCALQELGVDGADAEPCDAVNGCDAGLVCADPASAPAHCDVEETGCCLPFCPTDDVNFVCPGSTVCLPWFAEGAAPEGLEHVGVCAQQI